MPKVRETRIVFAGGGSGGHVYPLIAVAESLHRYATQRGFLLGLHYIGPASAYQGLFEQNEVAFHPLAEAKFRRYASFANLLDIPKFFVSVLQAIGKLYVVMPDVILSKGGPGALPVVLAGWWYRIPIVIHESDAIPGLANTISAKFARRIAVSFTEASQHFPASKTFIVGGLIRQSLYEKDIPEREAKEKLGFDPDRPLLLVLGGSLGSKRINDFIISHLLAILPHVQVMHQTGIQNYDEMKRAAETLAAPDDRGKTPYHPVPYLTEEYATALSAADCILSRAGSGTIFEAMSFGKPAILIPLPGSANNHQHANAKILHAQGAARIIEETNLTPSIFIGELNAVMTQSTQEHMRAAAVKMGGRSGAMELAKELLACAGLQ